MNLARVVVVFNLAELVGRVGLGVVMVVGAVVGLIVGVWAMTFYLLFRFFIFFTFACETIIIMKSPSFMLYSSIVLLSSVTYPL